MFTIHLPWSNVGLIRQLCDRTDRRRESNTVLENRLGVRPGPREAISSRSLPVVHAVYALAVVPISDVLLA